MGDSVNENICVSVIVPVYNVEKYLARCIDSIRSQTYRNIEIILIDDGATDSSGSICDHFSKMDKRISSIHKENGGLSSARNYGIRLSQGEYFCFIDSDDLIHPQYIEILVEGCLNNHAQLAMAYYKPFFDESEITKSSINSFNTRVMSGNEIAKLLYTKEYVQAVIACNKVIHRSLLQEITFPEGRIYEDEATTYKIMYQAKKAVVIPIELYFYYQRQGSITKSGFSLKRKDYLMALKERMNFFKNKGNVEQQMLAGKLYFYDLKAFLLMLKINHVDDKDLKTEIQIEIKNTYNIVKKLPMKFKTNTLFHLFYYCNGLYEIYLRYKWRKER